MATGSFESEVRDAGSIASWGQISWSAEAPPGTSLEMLTRSGNSLRPDSTWSEWSQPYRQAEGEKISSPPARYVQWKAVFRAAADSAPVLSEVTLAYLPQNRAPVMTEVKVTPSGGGASSSGPTRGNAATSRSVQNMATAGIYSRGVSSSGASSRRASGQQALNMTWLANDPDRDELAYELFFRGEGETEWKLLAKDLKAELLSTAQGCPPGRQVPAQGENFRRRGESAGDGKDGGEGERSILGGRHAAPGTGSASLAQRPFGNRPFSCSGPS